MRLQRGFRQAGAAPSQGHPALARFGMRSGSLVRTGLLPLSLAHALFRYEMVMNRAQKTSGHRDSAGSGSVQLQSDYTPNILFGSVGSNSPGFNGGLIRHLMQTLSQEVSAIEQQMHLPDVSNVACVGLEFDEIAQNFLNQLALKCHNLRGRCELGRRCIASANSNMVAATVPEHRRVVTTGNL